MNDVLIDRIDEMVEPSPGPGPMLRDARKAKQLDQLEVAHQLNLDLWVIDALERDDHARLPPATFVRGYLRSYARLVELPVAGVLAAYERVLRAEPAPDRPRRAQSRSVQRDEKPLRRAAVIGLLVLLAGVTGWWSVGTHRTMDPAAPVVAGGGSVSAAVAEPAADRPAAPMGQPATAAPAPEPAPEPAPMTIQVEPGVPGSVSPSTPAGPQSAASAPEAVVPANPVVAAKPAVPAESAPATAEPAAGQAAPVAGGEPAPVEAAQPPAAARALDEPVVSVPTAAGSDGADELVLRYQADCWTSVHDADGKRLAYDLVKAGEVLSLQGKAPFRVTLGNAPAVNVQLNGEPVDTLRFSRGRIARFEIPAGA